MGFEVGRIGIQRGALFTGYLPLFQGVATHVKCCPPKCHHLQILHIIKITGWNSNSHTWKLSKSIYIIFIYKELRSKNIRIQISKNHLSKKSNIRHFIHWERNYQRAEIMENNSILKNWCKFTPIKYILK